MTTAEINLASLNELIIYDKKVMKMRKPKIQPTNRDIYIRLDAIRNIYNSHLRSSKVR